MEWNVVDNMSRSFALPHVHIFFRCQTASSSGDAAGTILHIPCRRVQRRSQISSELPVGIFGGSRSSAAADRMGAYECSEPCIRREARVNNFAPCPVERYDDMCFAVDPAECPTTASKMNFPMQPISLSGGANLSDGNWMYIYTTNDEFIVAPMEWNDFDVTSCDSLVMRGRDSRVGEWTSSCMIPAGADLIAAGALSVKLGLVFMIVSGFDQTGACPAVC